MRNSVAPHFPMLSDQRRGELSQLFGDQEGIAATADVEHSATVQVEAGLEAVVGAQHFHR